MNIEGALVAAYNADETLIGSGFEASTDVPEERDENAPVNVPGDTNLPDLANEPAQRRSRLVTVERVGGPRRDVRDLPLLAIQVWAESRWVASEFAGVVAEVTRSLAVTDPNIARVSIESIYNNPDPYSEHPRYQVNAQITTT